MASHTALLVLTVSVSILNIRAQAQIFNDTQVVSNSSKTESIGNSKTTVEPELPPGGLPEVIVDLPVVKPTTPTAPVSLLPPASAIPDPQVAAKQIEEHGVLKTLQVINPDAFSKTVIGSKCSNATDCLAINNTSCISGICDCVSGFIPSKHSLDKCMKVPTGLDDTCEEEAQCAHVVVGSECKWGKCACPPNYVFDQDHCWERQFLGGICNTSLQCENVLFSFCAQGVCTCQTPLIPSPNGDKCLQSAGPTYRASCEEDIQCTDSYGDEAHCTNSQCICTNNYHFNGTICMPDKKLGEACESDIDCAVSDVNNVEESRSCVSQVCGCAPGFTYLQGEDICMENSSGEKLAVSLLWVSCIVITKYYVS